MKLMIPFTPHLAHECLSNLNCTDGNKWPKIDEKVLKNTKINMVVQVNGKTRDVLNIKKNLNETEINKLIMKSSKANKHLVNKTIIKTIFVKNKIINYIIKN
jgi:leucyl-tRNA synthetase